MSEEKAFEYVIGTLRGKDRREFEKHCQQDPDLLLKVNTWEDKLMGLETSKCELPPKDNTWHSIQQQLNQAPAPHKASNRLWSWFMAYALSIVVLVSAGVFYLQKPNLPPEQYIAVLSDAQGQAALTALTISDQKKMWLQWENTSIKQGSYGQLWAISRRDGVARSIAVFEDTQKSSLTLSTAQWRLITDAQYLILTEEESGGSAIDEPSDRVLAKGVCVRYQSDKQS